MNMRHRSSSGSPTAAKPEHLRHSGSALSFSARFWFIVTVIGQWIFAYYIASLYMKSAVQGKLDV